MPKPLPIQYAPTSRPKPVPRWVRCLGPVEAEHKFLSPDPTKTRLCERCRRKVASMGVSVRDEPLRAHAPN